MGNKQAERLQRVAKLYEAASPELQAQVMGLLQATVARCTRHQAAIKQAVIHASFEDVERGARVLESINLFGESLMDKYHNQPFPLGGLAFVAGVADGKQQERDRRRHAAIKQAIKETGNVPQEYME